MVAADGLAGGAVPLRRVNAVNLARLWNSRTTRRLAGPVVQAGRANLITLIKDEFSAADGTDLTAHTIAPINLVSAVWTTANKWKIYSNRAQQTANYGLCYLDTTRANLTVSLNWRRDSGAPAFQLRVRWQDGNNYYRIHLDQYRWNIQEIVGGVSTTRANEEGGFTAGYDHLLVVVLSGTSIVCTNFAETTRSLSYASMGYFLDATHIGLYGSTTACYVDNFQVTAP